MYTVVVADDEAELRSALVRRVDWESVGFRVVGEAENGVEALELVEKYEPDLLLTDIRMPFLSGIELARSVREVRPATQIAFLSGFDDFSYAQQAIQYNIVSYMLKPISAEELTEELEKIRIKIDEKYKQFAGVKAEEESPDIADFVMPLLLDGDFMNDEAPLEEALRKEALRCGYIKELDQELSYMVMGVRFVDENRGNNTDKATVHAVNLILEKYVKYVSFYVGATVWSVVWASPSRLEKYMHIIVEEIAQAAKRIVGKETMIGVSRIATSFSSAHTAYKEARDVICYVKETGAQTIFIEDVERIGNIDAKHSSNILCEKAKEIIESQYMNQELSLSSVSREIAVSPNYLSALIKKVTGSTFIDLLSRKRIEVAKDLLLNSDMKIREIAERCGYSDQHYFSYCFKKYTGSSPNACRRK